MRPRRRRVVLPSDQRRCLAPCHGTHRHSHRHEGTRALANHSKAAGIDNSSECHAQGDSDAHTAQAHHHAGQEPPSSPRNIGRDSRLRQYIRRWLRSANRARARACARGLPGPNGNSHPSACWRAAAAAIGVDTAAHSPAYLHTGAHPDRKSQSVADPNTADVAACPRFWSGAETTKRIGQCRSRPESRTASIMSSGTAKP